MSYEIKTDVHTHTIASDHAYSTLMENVWYAKKIGLEMIGMTDHGPDLVDAPHEYFFSNLSAVPREIEGVRILRGAEANIIDYQGNLDIKPEALKKLDLVIASLHEYVLVPGTVEQHDNVWRNIAQNPLVDLIGHSGQASYRYSYEEIIPIFGQYNKIVEINSHSPAARKGSYENCVKIAALCKRHGVNIAVNSDAHICFEVGKHDMAKQILEEVDFPEELIVNQTAERLLNFLKEKKNIRF